jgi:carbon monoxide dehydrogenase subunit G
VEQSGEYRIAAGLEEVWRGLNDPEVLARCIDGCQSMEKRSDEQFVASVKARVGPVSATFSAELNLLDVNPPSSYTIQANVKGGAAGFGKGTAEVILREDGAATLLSYQVKASVGGKLAQIGSRLIDGTARKMADDFFAAFGQEVSGVAPQATGTAAPGADKPRYERSGNWIIWAVMFAALATAMILAF